MCKNFIIALKFYILLFCCAALANGHCTLSFPSNRRLAPSYEKYFGVKKIKVPYTEDNIFIQEGESITAYCETTFNEIRATNRVYNGYYYQPPSDQFLSGRREIKLTCSNGQLKCGNFENGFYTIQKDVELSCMDLQLSLYEAKATFPWCQSTVGSYILGTESLEKPAVVAAVCYDVEKRLLHSLNYFGGSKKLTEDHNNLTIISPSRLSHFGDEIKNFRTILNDFDESKLTKEFHTKSLVNYWLKLANYDYKPIVQGGPYSEYLKNFEQLLNVIWWPNLRYGNWKRFMNALDERTNNFTYNVFTGISGAVIMPLENKCLESNILKLGNINKTVPAYVWTYLKAMDDSEEFVFIGYNSPFFDFFVEKDIVFCDDICSQISWLKDINSTFRYSTLGVTFCCTVESVRKSNLLDGFPKEFIPTAITSEPTTNKVVTVPSLDEGTTVTSTLEMMDLHRNLPWEENPEDLEY